MPKKSLGQNFLKNKEILSNIIKCGDISKEDIILEIDQYRNLTEMMEKNQIILL